MKLALVGCGFLGRQILAQVAQLSTFPRPSHRSHPSDSSHLSDSSYSSHASRLEQDVEYSAEYSGSYSVIASITEETEARFRELRQLGGKPLRFLLNGADHALSRSELLKKYAATPAQLAFLTSDAYVLAFPPRRRLGDIDTRYPNELALWLRLLEVTQELDKEGRIQSSIQNNTENSIQNSTESIIQNSTQSAIESKAQQSTTEGGNLHRTQPQKPRKMVFISSTSVYSDFSAVTPGERSSSVDERDCRDSGSISGRTLRKVETMLRTWSLDNPAVQVSILRLGGLVGAGRHPYRFYENMTALQTRGLDHPTNLIHVEDAAALVLKILHHAPFPAGEIFNGVVGTHPTRRELYGRFLTQKTSSPQLTPHSPGETIENKPAESKPAKSRPAGNKPAESKPAKSKPAGNKSAERESAENKSFMTGKIVSNQKVKDVLAYQFRYNDIRQWAEESYRA